MSIRRTFLCGVCRKRITVPPHEFWLRDPDDPDFYCWACTYAEPLVQPFDPRRRRRMSIVARNASRRFP